MPLNTIETLKNELKYTNQPNEYSLKRMIQSLLSIVEQQDRQIKQLQFDLVFIEEKTKDL